MAVLLTDTEIQELLLERKLLSGDFRQRLQTRPKRGHSERELDIAGDDGSVFRLIVRQSTLNVLDFSVILGFQLPGTNQLFRLRRCNGKSHQHTNVLEGDAFYDFHIHHATERYQVSGLREDSFAEPTDRYVDLGSAVECLITDCGFDRSDLQTSFFDEGATT